MAPKRVFLHYVRYTHLYLGVFIAPALLFFAFTGALQTFSFHETTRGSSYKPPAWIVTLAQIHKKQTTQVPNKKPQPPAAQSPIAQSPAAQSPAAPSARHAAANPTEEKLQLAPKPSKTHNPLPLKLFFLLVSLGLFTSTLSGIYMSYRYSRNRPLITALLLAGIILPVALLFL